MYLKEAEILNFCTLFDSNYLSRGLALYDSLLKYHDNNFMLYVVAFDSPSYEILSSLNLKQLTVVSLAEFEAKELLAIKHTRNSKEYCWTCTPSVIKYCLKTFDLKICTYLDADIYFFSSGLPLIQEMLDNNKEVLITEHRYTPGRDRTSRSGKYCVQFMTFTNHADSIEVLNWWLNACLDWCYDRVEDGKFGDQKYLDDWLHRFDCVHSLEHLGGGVAPWNIQQYSLEAEKMRFKKKNFDLVFYHFHGLKYINDQRIDIGAYPIRNAIKTKIYTPYILNLEKHHSQLNKRYALDGNFHTGKLFNSWKKVLFLPLLILLGRVNTINLNTI